MLHAPSISIQGYGTFGDKEGIIYRRFINPSKLYAEGGLGWVVNRSNLEKSLAVELSPCLRALPAGNRNCDTLTKLNFPGQDFSVLEVDLVFNQFPFS